jgi:hypothetical protein
MRGRSSVTEYVYDGRGCVHVSGGTTGQNNILNTELHIPDGSVIKFLRLYYVDTSPTGSVTGYITYIDPATSVVDLVSAASVDIPGSKFVVSREITHTVDNSRFAYTLIGWPSAPSVNLQVCGLRVAYYPPPGPVWMPLIRR